MKTVAAIIFLITRSLADGIRLFATALVISVVTGVPVPWTVISLGAAMIIYTVRGGVSAVIWTDVVQMFVYIAVALVVFFALWSRIPGGWSEVMSAGAAAGKFVVLDLSWSPATIYTLWAGFIGGIALTLATHGTDQFLVQRLLSARSAREASLGLVLSGFVVFAQFVLFLLIGVMLFVYHQHVAAPVLRRMDEILPLFIVNHLSGGVAGFIVAAIVAAALSPSLNAMAATTVNDFYKRYVRPDADERRLMRISRQATIAWGAVQLAVALGAQWMDRSVLDAGVPLGLGSGGALRGFDLLRLATAAALGDERLSMEQAVTAYSHGSAIGEFEDKDKGRLAVGALADLAVLSRDPFAATEEELRTIRAVLTMIGGRPVYDVPRP